MPGTRGEWAKGRAAYWHVLQLQADPQGNADLSRRQSGHGTGDVKLVVRSRGKVGGFPTFQMWTGSLSKKPEPFVAGSMDTYLSNRLHAEKTSMLCQSRVVSSSLINSEIAEKTPMLTLLGRRLAENKRGRRRR